jgi:hypothetical protein
MPEFTDNQMGSDDESSGDLVPIVMPLGAVMIVSAHGSGAPLPLPARMARLGRQLRGEEFRPVLAWRNSNSRARSHR